MTCRPHVLVVDIEYDGCGSTRYIGENIDDNDGIILLKDRFRVRRVHIALEGLPRKKTSPAVIAGTRWHWGETAVVPMAGSRER
jgi:hypothetical protein